jgi:hypothetical protein
MCIYIYKGGLRFRSGVSSAADVRHSVPRLTVLPRGGVALGRVTAQDVRHWCYGCLLNGSASFDLESVFPPGPQLQAGDYLELNLGIVAGCVDTLNLFFPSLGAALNADFFEQFLGILLGGIAVQLLAGVPLPSGSRSGSASRHCLKIALKLNPNRRLGKPKAPTLISILIYI